MPCAGNAGARHRDNETPVPGKVAPARVFVYNVVHTYDGNSMEGNAQ